MRRTLILWSCLLALGSCLTAQPAAAQTKFYQYYQKGLDYVESGDRLRALDHFESAASLAFEDTKRKRIYGTRFIKYYPHLEMARIYSDLGEFANARREVELSLAFENSKNARKLMKQLGGGEFEPPLDESEPPAITELMPDDPITPLESPTREELAAEVGEDYAELLSPAYDPTEIPRVGERLAMAVLPFTQQGGDANITSRLTDELIAALVNLRRFTILDRNALDKLLDEQALSMSGLIDEQRAVEAGKIAGADAVVIGALSVVGGSGKIHTKVIDTETSETLAARDYSMSGGDFISMEDGISRLAILIYNDLPLVNGSVVFTEGELVYVDIGAGQNMRRGTKCIVFREGDPVRHPKTRKVLGVRRELMTEIVVTEVQPKMSIGRIIPGTGDGTVAVGDKVVVK